MARKIIIIIIGLAAVVIGFWIIQNASKKTQASNPNSIDELVIPKINFMSPISYVEGSEGAINHVKGTAMPGEVGNVYLVTSPSYSEQLEELKVGDSIIIRREQAASLAYEVIDIQITSNLENPVTSQINSTRKLLTIKTAYSSAGANDQYLVVAELK